MPAQDDSTHHWEVRLYPEYTIKSLACLHVFLPITLKKKKKRERQYKHTVWLACTLNKHFLAFLWNGWDFLGCYPAKRHPLGAEIAEWRAFQLKTGTCKIPQTQLSAHNSLSQVDTASLWMAFIQDNCENVRVNLKEVLWHRSAHESI